MYLVQASCTWNFIIIPMIWVIFSNSKVIYDFSRRNRSFPNFLSEKLIKEKTDTWKFADLSITYIIKRESKPIWF